MGGGLCSHTLYDTIISKENLFSAWSEFRKGKNNKKDVLEFSLDAEERILDLHKTLASFSYKHGRYSSFYVFDPKKRHIRKAEVKDRIIHRAVYRILYPIFNKKFIFDSYSSRKRKGTHRAVNRFDEFAWRLSQNNTEMVWILKCDIRKFFDSIEHKTLLAIFKKKISCGQTINLLDEIIASFEKKVGRGIPLGNLTSQLFSNVYMDLFDQFAKRELRQKFYIRYADDFVFLSRDKEELEEILQEVKNFLSKNLSLELHFDKVEIKKWPCGVDFLGFISFPFHRILRTKTKKRIFKKINSRNKPSYLGVLSHCRSFSVKKRIFCDMIKI